MNWKMEDMFLFLIGVALGGVLSGFIMAALIAGRCS